MMKPAFFRALGSSCDEIDGSGDGCPADLDEHSRFLNFSLLLYCAGRACSFRCYAIFCTRVATRRREALHRWRSESSENTLSVGPCRRCGCTEWDASAAIIRYLHTNRLFN